jgi:hypothetical protein
MKTRLKTNRAGTGFRFKISNQRFLEIRDVDEDNQKLIVKLRINGEEAEREIDTSALE